MQDSAVSLCSTHLLSRHCISPHIPGTAIPGTDTNILQSYCLSQTGSLIMLEQQPRASIHAQSQHLVEPTSLALLLLPQSSDHNKHIYSSLEAQSHLSLQQRNMRAAETSCVVSAMRCWGRLNFCTQMDPDAPQKLTRLMAATSSEGPTSREVPLSAMALQPPLQAPEAPGTFTLSISICQ